MTARSHRRAPARRRCTGEDGESLIELLLAIVILGTVGIAVIGGFLVSVVVSDHHRKDAVALAAAQNYAQAVVTSGAYVNCGGPGSYTPAAVGYASVPSGYSASAAAVRYWNGTSYATTCGTDSGVQAVTVQVASNDGRTSQSVTVVIRQ